MVSTFDLLKYGILGFGILWVSSQGTNLGRVIGSGFGGLFKESITGVVSGVQSGLGSLAQPVVEAGKARGEEVTETRQEIVSKMVESGATDEQVNQFNAWYDLYAATSGIVPGLGGWMETIMRQFAGVGTATSTQQGYQGAAAPQQSPQAEPVYQAPPQTSPSWGLKSWQQDELETQGYTVVVGARVTKEEAQNYGWY